MRAHPLIFGSVALGLAGGVAAWVWKSGGAVPPPSTAVAAAKIKSKTAAMPPPVTTRPAEQETNDSAKTVPPAPVSARAAEGSLQPAAANPQSPPRVLAGVTEQELQRRAARVEQEANHDLQHLVRLLDLSEAQQDQIFDTLVQRAPGWHPSMQARGLLVPSVPFTDGASPRPTAPAPTESPTAPADGPLLDAIAADLTPDQQTELANAELDRQEWWEEIIPRLMPDRETLDTAVVVPGDTGSGTAAAAPPPPDGGPADSKSGDEPGMLDEGN